MMNEDEMRDAVVLVFANTLRPSTAIRLGKIMSDVLNVEIWWWYAGGTGGDSAVAGSKFHAPGLDGAGYGS